MAVEALPPNHVCIQAERIVRIDKKIDDIDSKIDHFIAVDGPIGKVSKQVERLTALVENGKDKSAPPPLEVNAKIPWLVVLGLVLIIAAIVGAKLPF